MKARLLRFARNDDQQIFQKTRLWRKQLGLFDVLPVKMVEIIRLDASTFRAYINL